GWTQDEAVGRGIMDLVVGSGDEELAGHVLETLRRGERWEGEFPMLRKDGTTVPALVTLAPILDREGNPIGSAGVSVDVSERQRQERRLAAQYAVTNALSRAEGMGDAAPQILQAVCEALDWEFGGMWEVDANAGV